MNTNPRFIRYGLQQGVFPFGFAVKLKQWAYVIYEDKLLQWINVTTEDIAKSQGESINGYVKKAVRGQIKADTGQDIEL